MKRPLGIGFVGSGFITRFHLQSFVAVRDAEIRGIIDEQYALARKLIEEHRDQVEAMAKALLEFETIDADQIADIMAGRTPRPPKPSPSAT